MATIERRGNNFRVIFYHDGRRHSASLKTSNAEEADNIAGSVGRTLDLIRQGSIFVPEGSDFIQFVLSGGRQMALPKSSDVRTFKQLRDRYLDVLGIGAVESSTLLTLRIHLDHVGESLGLNFPIQELGLQNLQDHVTRRRKELGRAGNPVQTATLKKEIASLRACWNWAQEGNLVKSPFPRTKALKYPKVVEKLPFRTFAEVARTTADGGLSEEVIKQLWESVFLTKGDIGELLDHVRVNARVDWLYPMFLFSAHTGARRSELIRAKVADLDFGAFAVMIWERKKDKSKHTYRRVPMTQALQTALTEWLTNHPGGPHLFCHNERLDRSSKKCEPLGVPLTRKEVTDHFKRTLKGSKWEKLKGWHVLRHSFVSNCAPAVHASRLDSWTGHQTEEMRKRYTHLIPTDERSAIESVFEPKRQ